MVVTDDSTMKECAEDPVLVQILQSMLDSDEDITFRAIAKRHPTLKAASSITRSSSRREVVEAFLEKQRQFRDWRDRGRKIGKERLVEGLAEKDLRIAELERQVETLRASHLVMIRAVAEVGATTKLLALYERYNELQHELDKMGLITRANVIPLPSACAKPAEE